MEKKYLFFAMCLLGASQVGSAQGTCLELNRDVIQAGNAVKLRPHVPKNSPDRQTVNAMVHADESHLKNGQPNPYYDPSDSYDPQAQVALEQLADKYGVSLYPNPNSYSYPSSYPNSDV